MTDLTGLVGFLICLLCLPSAAKDLPRAFAKGLGLRRKALCVAASAE